MNRQDLKEFFKCTCCSTELNFQEIVVNEAIDAEGMANCIVDDDFGDLALSHSVDIRLQYFCPNPLCESRRTAVKPINNEGLRVLSEHYEFIEKTDEAI